MGIAIPGLSSEAEKALRDLTATMKKKGARLDNVASSLDSAVRQEFANVSRALDLRFGRDAVLRGEKSIVNSLAPSQRRAFDAMQKRLQFLQKTVRVDNAQQIAAERQRRALDRGKTISR